MSCYKTETILVKFRVLVKYFTTSATKKIKCFAVSKTTLNSRSQNLAKYTTIAPLIPDFLMD